MILNRQFIKILEDLGIHAQGFLDLQAAAMRQLREMTDSPINTATFLENGVECCRATRMPSLIRQLGQIGLDYRPGRISPWRSGDGSSHQIA